MKNTFFFSFLLLLLFLFSCESDTPSASSAKMVVEKDGVSFTITDFTNTLLDDMQFDSTGRRLDLRAEVDGGTLIITISNWNWQNPPVDGVLEKSYDVEDEDTFSFRHTECSTGPSATYCDGGLGTYLIGNDIFITGTDFSNSEGVITITENDPGNKTVSGSFDFIVDEFSSDSTITFKGTFENLVYLR